MPVRPVGRGCFKWGHRGHKYCGPGAEKKAERQGRAAYYNGYRGQEMMMASNSDKKRWDDLHAAYAKANEAFDDYDIKINVKYGRNPQASWLSSTEQKKLESLKARRDKIGDKIIDMIVKLSPRGDRWLSGVPSHWLLTELTWEDMIRPVGEPLSVVTPASWGGRPGAVQEDRRVAARGGTTYRITIKYWDRHYGDGHTQFSQRFEARTSKKADEEAIKILEDALRVHSKPQGRIAEAWAERSDRNGPKTLRKYDGSSGQWVEVTPMRPAESPTFRRLTMRESNPKEELKALEAHWYDQGVRIEAVIGAQGLHLYRIEVPKKARGDGTGTAAMRDLIKFADEHQVTVTLTPSTDFGGSSVARLRAFYKRFGFVDNTGRNRDFEVSASMYRLPKTREREMREALQEGAWYVVAKHRD